MHTRTVEQVESWDARPFSGGVRELRSLADGGFSGAVVVDDTWLFLLNGRVVGVFQGEVHDVEGGSGTAYTAPHPSLPLLFSMQERGGTTQAKYFTKDTPLEEADATLREANFTGYVELAENVLSGDYYVVYYGGKSMSAAFIGQSERLEAGDEAFARAADEVGVYEVRKVPMNVTEIPAPADPEPNAGAAAAGAMAAESAVDEDDSSTSDSDAEADDGSADGAAAGIAEAEAPADEADVADDAAVADQDGPGQEPIAVDEAEAGDAEADPRAAEADAGAAEADPAADEVASEPAESDRAARTDDADAADAGSAAAGAGIAAAGDSTPDSDAAAGDGAADEGSAATTQSEHARAVSEWAKKDRAVAEERDEDDPFREEAAWQQSTAIPALDPEASRSRESTGSTSGTGSGGAAESDRPSRATRHRGATRQPRSEPSQREESTETSASTAPDEVTELRTALEEREARIAALESELADATDDRADLREQVERLTEERDELAATVDRLESKLESARAAADAGPAEDAGPNDLDAGTALAGTNLFVRYESKGKPTLSSLGEARVDREAINENLRLEHHTQFDATDATVAGTPYERFLHESGRYRFVDWLIRDLPYELLESDARGRLVEVYDAVPTFDRIEFDGAVEVTDVEGETSTHTFDVVVRNRMGEPLVVAALNESRDPVRGDAMGSLVDSAIAVGEGAESVAGAFYVTASFFEPDALERAQGAASEGGFFNRTDRGSFVKTGRKTGFHLCLVEDRQNAFHLTVPEL